MNANEITETIKLLSEANVHSAYRVTTFIGCHKDDGKDDAEVTITVRDYGENAPVHRFYANATWKGGMASREGEGNTIAEAVRSIFFSWKRATK
jgi:hypothetical protein